MREAGLESISLTQLWQGLRSKADVVTYPVAGAWVERLRQKGGDEKLKELLRRQTLESARGIYGEELEKWIKEFEQDLFKP